MVGCRGSLMSGHGRMPVMGVDRGGYSLAGHPIDYYCNPYHDEKIDFYGGGRPPYHRGVGKVV